MTKGKQRSNEELGNKLLQAVKEMKAGNAASVTRLKKGFDPSKCTLECSIDTHGLEYIIVILTIISGAY